MKIAFAALIALVISMPSEAQELWSEAKVSMSVEQVRRIFPETVTPTAPQTFRDRKEDIFYVQFLTVSTFRSLPPAFTDLASSSGYHPDLLRVVLATGQPGLYH